MTEPNFIVKDMKVYFQEGREEEFQNWINSCPIGVEIKDS